MLKYSYIKWIGLVLSFSLVFILVPEGILIAQSSPNYQMIKYVIDDAGSASQSTNHLLFDVVGQPSPVGEMISTNYTLSSGFLGQAIIVQFRGIKLTASDGDTNDTFGMNVGISGDYIAIGSPSDDNENGIDAGSVYIFRRDGNNWIEHQKLMATDGAENDIFGNSLEICDDYLVIGAPWDDDLGIESGSAYIFVRDGSNWVQQAKLTASDAGPDNRFGIDVAIHGDYVIVGAFFDNDFGTRSGSAYIFKRNGTSWIEQEILTASDGAEADWFGVSVSINGDYAAVGSRYDDNENGNDAGAVYIFKRDGTNWNEQKKLIASDGAAGDLFHKATVHGDQVVVGAYQDDDKGNNSGSIYIFRRNGADWIEQEKHSASDGEADDFFGSHIAMSGDRMVVSAYRDDDNGANSGSIYVFKYDGASWHEDEKILAYDGDAGDFFGLPVDIDQNFIVVGARNDDDKGNNAGAAYVYGSVVTPVLNDYPTRSDASIFYIYPAYPNPFNPATTIQYTLPQPMKVNISIFNMLGQRIKVLENELKQVGFYSVQWDGKDESGNSLTSGVYICQIQAGEYRKSVKMMLVR